MKLESEKKLDNYNIEVTTLNKIKNDLESKIINLNLQLNIVTNKYIESNKTLLIIEDN